MCKLTGEHQFVKRRDKKGQFTGEEVCTCGEIRQNIFTSDWNNATTYATTSGTTALSFKEMQIMLTALDRNINAQSSLPDRYLVLPQQAKALEKLSKVKS